MKGWLLLIVGVALVTALVFLRRGSAAAQPQAAREGQTPPEQMRAMANEMATMREHLARLELNAQSTGARTVSPPEAPKPATSAEPELDPAQALAREQSKRAERIVDISTGLDARLASEPADASAQASAREMREAAANLDGTTVQASECSASLCRVVMTHASRNAQTAANLAVAEIPIFGAVFYHNEPDTNPPRTTLYVVRPGYDFNDVVNTL